MYAAKASGKHRFELFESELHAPIVERLRLKGDLQTALDEGQFVLHYQPVVDLDTRAIVGAEALVRWEHPERGLVAPGDFIPVAEQTGVIVPLGRWVMREALRQVGVWRERHAENAPAYVAVNVAGRQLEAANFVDEVADVLAQSGLPASTLIVEVAETSLIEDTDKNTAKLAALREMGVRLANDDFGTGYSALSYLRRFPMDILKIDRSFISNVAGTSQESALVEAMISMSASLGLKVVAEGIEQDRQFTRLQELRCSYGQGYLFSRPVPATSIDALLAEESLVAVA